MTAQDALRALSANGFDRAGEERTRPGLLAELMADSSTRILVIHRDGAPLAGERLHLHGAAELPDAGSEPELAFLGRSADRAAVVAAVYPGEAERAA
ncbi:MAG TPA: hypothetical protein VN107_09650, partial [Microbacterium sp.]|nr:hypothetical protein [Microbacterium sp.]